MLTIHSTVAYYLSVQPYFNSYLMVVQNKDATTASYITQTFSFASTVTSVVISVVIKHTRRYKWYVTAGSLIYLMGMGLMVRYRTENTSTGSLVGTQIAVGIGGGMLNVPAQLGVQASASHQQVGAATAAFLTLISVGNAIGAAISGAVWGRLVPAKLEAYLPASEKANAGLIYGSVPDALSYPVGSPERDAINRAYQETMSVLLNIAVGVCVPIVLLSLLMRDYKLDQVEQGVKGRVIGGDVGMDEGKVRKRAKRHAVGS
jgi:hypothetical protein